MCYDEPDRLTEFQRNEEEDAVIMLTTGTEWTTAFTDLLNGLIAIIPIVWCLTRKPFIKRYRLWAAAFGMLSAMSIAGFFAHGFVMSQTALDILWCVLYLFMTFMVCAYVIAVKYDLDRDEGLDRFFKTSITLAVIVAVCLGVMEFFLPDYSFWVFSAYALGNMIYCLIRLWGRAKETSGFWWYIVGIIVMIVGSVLQMVKSIHFTIVWEYNYNAVYHFFILLFILIQFNGIGLVAKQETFPDGTEE